MEIRKFRIQSNLTQLALATAMQVDRSTISCWENGIAMPRSEQLPKLADIFGCTIDALFGRETRDSA